MSTPRPKPNLALIGASGFVGLRTTEIFSHLGEFNLIPVVRSPGSLAVVARQALPWRISHFMQATPLAEALKGCEICVHAAIGDASQITRMAEVTYEACAKAGVKRLVWLSSASVHGQDCAPGTTEASPLHDHHPMVYNNAKVRAEWALEKLARDRRVEVVRLRPGVVFGPRSRWITDAAASLREGSAAWLKHGQGICNSIYVDNLVEAIRLAAITPGLAGQVFLIGDNETVTWSDFLGAIARHLGYDHSAFHDIAPPRFAPEKESRFAAFTLTPAYANAGRMVPDRAKRLVKSLLRAWPSPPPLASAWKLRSTQVKPHLTQEHALLQQCTWKFPHALATQKLGYLPPVSFQEGMSRSLAWLDFVEGRA